jgi:cell wall-associated NlpC family hydrolase
MSRIGFDYVTVLPDGSVLLLASLHGAPFEITERAMSPPAQSTAAAFRSDKPATIPSPPPPPVMLRSITTPGRKAAIATGDEATIASPKAIAPAPAFVSRREQEDTMNAFRDESWFPSQENLRNPCQSEIVAGWGINCRDATRFVRPPQFVREPYMRPQVGVPYDWGGADTVAQFERKLAEGYVAGNIGGTFWADGHRRVTTGVDCSGLVSNVWKLGRHVPTLELDSVSTPLLTLSQLRLGDAFLLPGHHVMLYRRQMTIDGASLAIHVTHAAPRCGAVCDNIFEIDFFHDYALRRRRN